ncbi:MAG: twin-arginine translocation signal domain-containing protein, partial [Phycisphaerae bacterium]|nr:twin-arginine translocation signal domain-containing protein [Phycisphaerae bacterium]
MPRQPISRRRFLKHAALAAAPYIIPASALGKQGATSPSERITLAIIGLKKMGGTHVQTLAGYDNVQILAVCDVDTAARDKARRHIEQRYAARERDGKYTGCDAYNEYERIMERPDI